MKQRRSVSGERSQSLLQRLLQWPQPKAPLVSVLLPSYNHERHVAEAVRSVLRQSLDDLELIVVDDASSDGTAAIVAAITDPRLKLIRLPHNREVHARNLAFGMARGHYIAFQNSDDVWMPDKLERQIEVMEKDKGLVACFTSTRIIDSEDRPSAVAWARNLFTAENRPPARWLRQFFDHGNCLPLTSAVVRSHHLQRLGGFRASLVQLSDFDLWIRLAVLGRFEILPEPLTSFRIVDGVNLSAPSPRTNLRTQIELSSVLERFIEPPALAVFTEIFPELVDPGTVGGRKAVIALRALERHGTAALMFTDRTFAGILDDAVERTDAVAAVGPDVIRDFLERRCNIAISCPSKEVASAAA